MGNQESKIQVQEVKPPAIEIRGLVKVYKLYDRARDRVKDAFGLSRGKAQKRHYALNGVNLCIRKGETVGIIGTNGSGKSTILKIITGVLSPTSGQVRVDGRISALLELGAGFNQEYNGIENVYLNGTMMGFTDKEIDEKLPDILEFADIGDYVNQPVKTYSSGMFVRLAFAVAINIEPEILIVDEALSVGDVFFQAKCYHKFEEFKKMGKTIVFVSHDLSVISKYCDRVFLLNKGTLLGEGSPKEMIDAYKRVLVGQYEFPEGNPGGISGGEGQAALEGDAPKPGEAVNPDVQEYGTRQAEILEYYLTDERGVRALAILKGSQFTLHMRVRFQAHVPAPIFAFSFKDALGTEITGTNTMIEKSFLESGEPGQVKDIAFTQKMSLQGGEYLLSLGVTGYEGDKFQVYHRLYDVLDVTVVSDKDTVGYYDMDSTVTVTDAREGQ